MIGTNFSNGYALLIGIGDDLPVTVKDAAALQKVLIDPGLAAYAPDHVQLLTETGATRKGILDAFDKLIEQVNINANATVIIYFSGHCVRVRQKIGPNDYFLLSYAFDLARLPETAISGLELTARIDALKARKLVVLLDCCHAEGISSHKGSQAIAVKSVPLPPNLLNILDKGSGRVVIASSQEDEYSYTGRPYSIFTACLLEALNGKASVNQDGFARILDIVIYLQNQVPQRAAPKQQHPFVNEVRNLDDNFPLCYYAGGSKAIPTTNRASPLPSFNSSLSPTSTLTANERLWLKEELNTLQERRSTIVKRLKLEQRAADNETTNPARKVQLDSYIEDDEKLKAELEARIQEIEKKLKQ